MLSKNTKSVFGVTLIELLVLFFIIAIIAGIVLTDYKSSNRRLRLDAAASELIIAFEEAKINAISGNYGTLNLEPLSWGVSIRENAGEYVLFIDRNNYRCCGSDTTLTTTPFPHDTNIEVVGAGPPNTDFSFQLFTGKLFINGSPPSIDTGVRFSDTMGGETKDITIKPSGLIEEQ